MTAEKTTASAVSKDGEKKALDIMSWTYTCILKDAEVGRKKDGTEFPIKARVVFVPHELVVTQANGKEKVLDALDWHERFGAILPSVRVAVAKKTGNMFPAGKQNEDGSWSQAVVEGPFLGKGNIWQSRNRRFVEQAANYLDIMQGHIPLEEKPLQVKYRIKK